MRWPWSATPSLRLEDAQADVLLQDLLSRDGKRITDAARTVARLFTASSLDALAAHTDLIEQHCQGIALGGMLISNQAHLKAALQRLRYWLAREGWTAPVITDPDGSVASAYGLTAFPFFVFVNADGTVAARATGELPMPELQASLAALER